MFFILISEMRRPQDAMKVASPLTLVGLTLRIDPV